MKKIWNDVEAISLDRLMFITIIAVLVVLVGFYSYFQTEDETDPRDDRAWWIKVEGDHYLIEINNVESKRLTEVSWSILNLSRLVMTWDDPADESIRMEGELIDINFTEADRDIASSVVLERFYSKEPTGNPRKSSNHTLCIVYFDDNSDGNLSNGDYIWVRPIANGGCAMEDYRFRIANTRYGIGQELLFPPFPEV